jgi:LysM repeat protein
MQIQNRLQRNKLFRCEDTAKDSELKGGEIIYIEEKKKRADKDHIVYVVRSGDSMYSISQKFGIRLKNLYKMNRMNPESPAPKVGDILRLR